MKSRIVVLQGGISPERTVSLKSGKEVTRALRQLGYEVVVVDAAEPGLIGAIEHARPDVVFIALHGPFGEDGTVQALLERAGIPYCGSGVEASILAMDKISTHRVMESVGVAHPSYLTICRSLPWPDAHEVRYPVVIKPNRGGSTLGTRVVHEPKGFRDAILGAFRYGGCAVLLEEFIQGRELTVAVIENPEVEALPIIAIDAPGDCFNYAAKYHEGLCRLQVPAPLSPAERRRVEETALAAYQGLGCRDVARVDLILREGTPYVLEVNTIPGFTERSLVPLAAQAAGMTFPTLITNLIQRGLERNLSLTV